MDSTPAASNRSPFSIVVDVIVAPKSAFEAIAAQPRWLVAYVVVCALGMAGAVLQIPVAEHVGLATLDQRAAHDPSLASASPQTLQNVKNYTILIQHVVWAFYPVVAIIGISLAALLLLLGNAIGRGQGSFAKFFSLAANIAIINFGIYYLLLGVLCAVHSPDAFHTQSDVVRLVPSPAWLVPDASPKVTVLLEEFNPFALWSFALLGLGLQTVGKVSTAVAFCAAAVIAFGNLVIAVPLAQ